jgi:hypothetical protein
LDDEAGHSIVGGFERCICTKELLFQCGQASGVLSLGGLFIMQVSYNNAYSKVQYLQHCSDLAPLQALG